MPALYVKVFAERNCGGTWLNRLLRKNFRVAVMDGTPALDGAALRKVLQTVPSQERLKLHNMLLDAEHDRLLYSDFGWTGGAPPLDIIRSAAHTRDTHFLICTMHPLRYLRALHLFPRTPGALEEETGFGDFLVQPFPLNRRDGLVEEAGALRPMQLYQTKMRACLDLIEGGLPHHVLRVEDLERDPRGTLATLQEVLLPKPGLFSDVPPVNRLLSLGEAQEAWVRLPEQIRRHVAREVSDEVLARLGYTMPDRA